MKRPLKINYFTVSKQFIFFNILLFVILFYFLMSLQYPHEPSKTIDLQFKRRHQNDIFLLKTLILKEKNIF